MPSEQHGFALITAVIFLVILSTIGIAAMQNTTTEQRMTTNMQDRNQAFQLAETELARAVHEAGQNTTSVLDPANPDLSSLLPANYSLLTGNVNVRTEIEYLGEGALQGQMLQQVQSIGTTALHVFEIRSTVRYNNSRVTHVQGISLVGPRVQ